MEKEGWAKSLNFLSSCSNGKIHDRLIKDSLTMPRNGTAPKAFQNKHEYKLWK